MVAVVARFSFLFTAACLPLLSLAIANVETECSRILPVPDAVSASLGDCNNEGDAFPDAQAAFDSNAMLLQTDLLMRERFEYRRDIPTEVRRIADSYFPGEPKQREKLTIAPPHPTALTVVLASLILALVGILSWHVVNGGFKDEPQTPHPEAMERQLSNRSALEEGEFCESLGTLARAVIRSRREIIVVITLLTLGSAYGAAFFISITDLGFQPSPGMISYHDNKHMNEVFPGAGNGAQYMALLQAHAGQDILEVENISKFCFALRRELKSSGEIIDFVSYPTLLKDYSVNGTKQLISNDSEKMLISWRRADSPTSKPAVDFADVSQRVLDSLVAEMLNVSFHGIIGYPTITFESIEMGEKECAVTDGISVTLALLVAMYFLQAERLLAIPVLCMLVAACMSFGFMYCVGCVINVSVIVPTVMSSVLIAMSLDYSLFILTRFKEELDKTPPSSSIQTRVEDAVAATIETAGFMVLMSGMLLTISFYMLVLFPVSMISSLGLGCGTAISIAIGLHLTLAPAVLTSFPEFFTKGLISDGALGAVRSGREPDSSTAEKFWRSMADVSTRSPWNIIFVVLVVGFSVFMGSFIVEMHTTNDMAIYLPSGTNLKETYLRAVDGYGAGPLNPYRLMMEPSNGTIWDTYFWEASQAMVLNFAEQLPNTTIEDFQFISIANGIEVPRALAYGCTTDYGDDVQICNQIRYMLDAFTHQNRTATWGYIFPSFEPSGDAGYLWLQQLRALAQAWEQDTGIRVTVSSMPADSFDVRALIYAVFPWMIGMTLSLVLVLLGIAYKSIVVPLRSIISIGLTLLWTYGLAVLTYQHGVLNWTRMPNLNNQYEGLAWVPPIISFTVVVGLCLDYDIFILTRATELRSQKKDPTEAICTAFYRTGSIVSAAGAIMAIAFGGLLFASMPNVAQIAFYLVFAVIFDTFIVRCLFTPASMSLLGRFNWWPSSLSDDISQKASKRKPDALISSLTAESKDRQEPSARSGDSQAAASLLRAQGDTRI